MQRSYSRKKDPVSSLEYISTTLFGDELLNLPALNKGSAFSKEERETLGLLGRLPNDISSLERQLERAYESYKKEPTNLTKYSFLMSLMERNETLFFALASGHIAEMLPILYTPTVGDAVKSFSHIFQRPRGLFISVDDIDNIEKIIEHRAYEDVDIVVVTDSQQILGIGDQGVGGIGIVVGKSIVYSLCAGICPDRILPIVLDVGTDNEKLLQDPLYLGLRHKRVDAKRYDEFVDRFVSCVKAKLPKALLHWEDFGRDNARALLGRYKESLATFNDDIEGTGAITLAALISATKIAKKEFAEHRIVIFGAGSAGIGVAESITAYLRHLGVNEAAARKMIWALGRNGLITESSDAAEFQKPFARGVADVEGWDGADLKNVVERVKPTILIGSSAQAGAFSHEIIASMSAFCDRPIVFVLSNPTSLAEAKPKEIFEVSGGRALVATGSPFEPFEYGGETIDVAQCNNALVYPGLGLGVIAAKASKITPSMLFAAAEAVAQYSSKNCPDKLLPGIDEALNVSFCVAKAVGEAAIKEGYSDMPKAELQEAIERTVWRPVYLPIKKEN